MSRAESSHLTAEVVAYPIAWRWIAATLFCFSRANLPLALVAVLRADDPPITPLMLAQFVAIFVLVPGMAARLVQRAFATRLEGDGETLRLATFRRHIEAPLTSVESAQPWAVPLPRPGLSLVLRSGGGLPVSLQPRTPADYVAALDLVVGGNQAALAHPTSVYARAQAAEPRSFWRGPIAKFVLFALPWAAIFFNLDQHISYGGTFGQYYLQGLLPWLASFAVHWLGVGIYLLLYASVWRGLAEAVALGAAWVVPAQAAGIRRTVEILCLIVLYAGVPLLVVSRFTG